MFIFSLVLQIGMLIAILDTRNIIKKDIKNTSIIDYLMRLPRDLYLKDRTGWPSPNFRLQMYKLGDGFYLTYSSFEEYPIPWIDNELSNTLFTSKAINNEIELIEAVDALGKSIRAFEQFFQPFKMDIQKQLPNELYFSE